MSVLVQETAKSRKRRMGADSMDVTLDYYAIGSTDDTVVYAALKLLTPKIYTVESPTGFPFVLRRNEISLETAGSGFWLASVDYGFKLDTADDTTDPPDTDDTTPAGPELSFDTTGGTAHLTQSFATVQSVGPVGGPAAPNYKQAIGVTRDGVAGVDVVSPKLEFTLTVPTGNLKRAYVRDLARNTGKTNSALWQGYQPGEVLFLGASGQSKPGNRFSITYKFAVQENRTNLVIRPTDAGDNVVGADGLLVSNGGAGEIKVDKKGWEYVWCAYRDTTDVNLLVQIPIAAKVERVYPSFNFSTVLGF